jgi:excisionase family DNA binding protein
MQTTSDGGILGAARELERMREGLRMLEAGVLSETARELAQTAEVLLNVTREIGRMRQPERWLRHEELAEELGVDKNTLYRVAKEQGMPRHGLTGREYRYSMREVDEWLLGR